MLGFTVWEIAKQFLVRIVVLGVSILVIFGYYR